MFKWLLFYTFLNMRFFEKRSKTLYVLTLLLVVINFLCSCLNGDKGALGPEEQSQPVDTIEVNRLMKEGNSLQFSIPDSATFCFLKAVAILDRSANNSDIKSLLATCYIRLASINNYSGNYSKSAYFDSLAMDIALSLKDKSIQGQCLNIKGLVCFNQSDYSAALDHYNQALDLALISGNKRLAAMVYTNAAIIHFYQGEFQEADKLFGKTIDTAFELQDSLLISGSYINRGMIAQHAGNFDDAVEYYTKAAEMCSRIHDENGVILCKQNIGGLLFNNGRTVEALDAFTESLQMALKQNDLANIAKGYHNMGEIYASVSDYETAIDFYLQSAKIKEQLNDLKGLASSYTSIGNLNYQRGNYKEALDDYKESFKINQKLDYQEGIAKDYYNFANLYRHQGRWTEGLDYAFKSLKIHRQIHEEEDLGNLYLIIGSLYSGKKDYENAERYLTDALTRAQEIGDTLQIATTENELIGIKLKKAGKTDDFGLRIQCFADVSKEAEYVSKLIENKQALVIQNETLGLLEEAYAGSGELEKALHIAREMRQISDSLSNAENSKYLMLAELKWKANKNKVKVSQLEELERQKDVIIHQKEKENKLQHLIIFLLVAIGLLLLTALLFLFLFIHKKREEFRYKQLHQLTGLRMKSIRNRISSHFFFNILSVVSTYEPDRLKQMLDKLILLFKKSVENIDQLTVTVREEMKLVEAFVDLQKLRLSDQFVFWIDIDALVDQEQLLPAMIIQIPVENAIKHGLFSLTGEQKLQIKIKQNENDLVICIIDNGVGFSKSDSRSKGTGTGLKVLYEVIGLLNSKNENKISFDINDMERESGTIVRITIPRSYQF